MAKEKKGVDKMDLSAFIAKAREKKVNTPMQKVVPVVSSKEIEKEDTNFENYIGSNIFPNDRVENQHPTINAKIYPDDYTKFLHLKQLISLKFPGNLFKIADVFNEGLILLKRKYKFPVVPDNEVLNTAGGRRLGTKNEKSLNGNIKVERKNTTVKLTADVLKLYNDYKTFKIKKNPDINAADLFKEMLETVSKKYEN
ncbi:hypothetical protein LPB90_18520 [Chryseobacterium sp. LC2016-29]|uniref:hypothetical protein n=1 Tax=Chryseobacterium sp. LC2016-29 TaxID=2897331 RepID=UPI001E5036A5|nr:hypothetical protein [Chryseobacterium sp. LC2016-29]MCD0480438.1 hypothetical protein [Chryseobacterium sp. LC2016-29]